MNKRILLITIASLALAGTTSVRANQLTGWIQTFGHSYFDFSQQTIEFRPGTTLKRSV